MPHCLSEIVMCLLDFGDPCICFYLSFSKKEGELRHLVQRFISTPVVPRLVVCWRWMEVRDGGLKSPDFQSRIPEKMVLPDEWSLLRREVKRSMSLLSFGSDCMYNHGLAFNLTPDTTALLSFKCFIKQDFFFVQALSFAGNILQLLVICVQEMLSDGLKKKLQFSSLCLTLVVWCDIQGFTANTWNLTQLFTVAGKSWHLQLIKAWWRIM